LLIGRTEARSSAAKQSRKSLSQFDRSEYGVVSEKLVERVLSGSALFQVFNAGARPAPLESLKAENIRVFNLSHVADGR
jgi:hypothetical protein